MITIQSYFHSQSGLVFQRSKPKKNASGKKYTALSLKAFTGQSKLNSIGQSTDVQEFVEVDSKYMTQVNDVVVRLRTPIQALIVEDDGVGIVVPSHVVILRLKEGHESTIDPKYFVHYFNSPSVQNRLEHQSKGSSMISMIQKKTLSEYKLPAFPPIEEQRKVVELMEMLEEEQQLQKRLLELSEKKRKAIMQHLFQSTKK